MGDKGDFLWILKNGDKEEFKKAVAQDPNIVNVMIEKRYPMHHAADYGQKEIIELLLQNGAKINEKDKYGITPLLSAIYEDHCECVKLLLSKGANKNEKAPDGQTYQEAAANDEIKALLK